MKMKILLCCLSFFLTTSVCLKADEPSVIIPLEKAEKDNKDKRSIQAVPTASHDGRTVYIHTTWPCDRLYIEVENADGMTVFAGTPDVLGNAEYSVEIPESGAGTYTLWVLMDETMYVGKFKVEKLY